MDAPPWTAREEYMGVEWRERGKKKEYVAARASVRGSARLGSARLGSTRSDSARLGSLDWKFSKRFSGIRFRGVGRGGGVSERVCVTLLADTGGFERKAHKYA